MSEGRKLEDDEAVIHGKQEAQILGCDFFWKFPSHPTKGVPGENESYMDVLAEKCQYADIKSKIFS